VADVFARLERLRPLTAPVGRGDDGRHDCGERDRLIQGWLGDRFGGALSGDDRPEDVHRVGVGLQALQRVPRAVLEAPGDGHLAAQSFELLFVRESSVPEEICGLLEARDLREIFDEVSAAIDQPSVRAVHLADGGLGRDHSLQSWAELRHFH